ncbi:MAG: sugar phosphate isomerase/epimerase family protein [Acidimicrobiales bacterium]
MGYDYVEIPVPDLCPEEPESAFRPTARAIETAGIPALAFNYLVPPALPIVGPAVDVDRLRRYVEVAAGRAASLGGSVFVLGSGPARRLPADFPRSEGVAQFRAFALLTAEAADRHGMTVALEAINRTETNFLHTLEEAVEHAHAIGRPAVGVLADAYHMHMESEPSWHLLETDGLLRHVQVCDEGRSFPGSRHLDLWGFFIYLNHLRYSGTVSVECRWKSFAAEGGPALEFVRRVSSTSGELAFAP